MTKRDGEIKVKHKRNKKNIILTTGIEIENNKEKKIKRLKTFI